MSKAKFWSDTPQYALDGGQDMVAVLTPQVEVKWKGQNWQKGLSIGDNHTKSSHMNFHQHKEIRKQRTLVEKSWK